MFSIVYGAFTQFLVVEKNNRADLLGRMECETQGAYQRLSVPNHAREEVAKIASDSLSKTGFGSAFIVKQELYDFWNAHPDLRGSLEPLMRTMDTAYDATLVSASTAIESSGILPRLVPSVASAQRDAHNKHVFCRLDRELQNMKPGESRLIMDAGSTNHAVSLELRKIADNAFSCLLYNTGHGLTMHQIMRPTWGGDSDKYHPITWTHISSARLGNEFFQRVISAKRLPTIEQFVDLLRTILGPDDEEAARSERAYYSQGNGTTCVYKSLSVALRALMRSLDPSESLYHQYKVESTERLLQLFDATFPEVHGPAGDPNRKPEKLDVTLGQLQALRDRAGRTLARRKNALAARGWLSCALSCDGSDLDHALSRFAQLFDTQDEVLVDRLAKHLGASGTVSQLHRCLKHPAFKKHNDLLRSQFIVIALKRARAIDAGEILCIMNGIENSTLLRQLCCGIINGDDTWDALCIHLHDKALVDALIGKGSQKTQDVVRCFCALGLTQAKTEAEIQEALAIASRIRDTWFLEAALISIARSLSLLQALPSERASQYATNILQRLDGWSQKTHDIVRSYLVGLLSRSSNVERALRVMADIQSPKDLARAIKQVAAAVVAQHADGYLDVLRKLVLIANSRPEETERYLKAVLKPVALMNKEIARALLKDVMEDHQDLAMEIIAQAGESMESSSSSTSSSSGSSSSCSMDSE